MQVRDVMTRSIFACGPRSLASEAARLMWEHDIGALPIVDEEVRPLGMVTDRDLCMACYTRGLGLGDFLVASVMSAQVVVCEESATLSAAEELMMSRQVRRLPVIDRNGKLVGIVSLNDIAACRARSTLGHFDDVAEVLMAICKRSQSKPPASTCSSTVTRAGAYLSS